MADKQYGLSTKEIKILREEAAKRAEMRQYFLKETYNPYRHATSKGGYLFDPAIQRYHSMSVSHLEHFRPTPKTSIVGIVLTFGIMGGYYLAVTAERESRMQKYRTGQVSYRDRPFKLI